MNNPNKQDSTLTEVVQAVLAMTLLLGFFGSAIALVLINKPINADLKDLLTGARDTTGVLLVTAINYYFVRHRPPTSGDVNGNGNSPSAPLPASAPNKPQGVMQ